ncbi:MAG: pyridoxamine 5'-phosphate oxidase family protein [Desulfobacterales bacterium]|nr:pyridoxamine 5'-phosphate oxidase family protein [Desulfobacterales bacterium]
MRRKDKEIAADEAVKLLAEGEYGILSTVDDAGQPYGIPINYVYKDHHIYFHCALTGQTEALTPLERVLTFNRRRP